MVSGQEVLATGHGRLLRPVGLTNAVEIRYHECSGFSLMP